MAMDNNLPEVRQCLSLRADVNAMDSDDWTSLYKTGFNGYAEVAKVLLDTELKDMLSRTPLHTAVRFGHVAVVNELLSPKDNNGATSRVADIEAMDA